MIAAACRAAGTLLLGAAFVAIAAPVAAGVAIARALRGAR